MKKQIVLILISFFSLPLFSQYEGEITGQLLDSVSNDPIGFAYMTLRQGSLIVMQTQTDYKGMYTLKPLSPGKYDLEILALGYDTARYYGIEVNNRGMTYQIFAINSGVILPPVTVTPPLVEIDDPTIDAKFSEEDLGHMAIDNALEAAVTAPQVQPNEQTGGLYIAGSREDATLYVVDGVKVIGSLYLPMKAIKEVNVITGGIPANYGDVTGGIIEITTKSYTGFY